MGKWSAELMLLWLPFNIKEIVIYKEKVVFNIKAFIKYKYLIINNEIVGLHIFGY